MVEFPLPYLWAAKGRNRDYWFYRRNDQRIPITDPQGNRLFPGDVGFLEAYERIHTTFGTADGDKPKVGSLGHLIDTYKAAPEFLKRAEKTRKDYARYLDIIKRKWGHLSVATMPREAVRKLRDDHQDRPRTANYLVSVLRLVLAYAEELPRKFNLPNNWQNPARRPKQLETGDGHRPWEESEIAAFRRRWPIDTVERVAFELALNTAQRGGDVVGMTRKHYFGGIVHVTQNKGGSRVAIPASADLRAVLDPWLAKHKHIVILATARGRPFKVDHFRHVMRDAYTAAGLPADCTTHGLRYTAATVLHEIGCDWEIISSITGHETVEMVRHYIRKKRAAKLAIASLDEARAANSASTELKTAADGNENRPRGGGSK
jgi:integrase